MKLENKVLILSTKNMRARAKKLTESGCCPSCHIQIKTPRKLFHKSLKVTFLDAGVSVCKCGERLLVTL